MIYLGNPSRPDVISAQTLICSSCCARWIQKVIKVGKRLPLHNIAYANTNTTDPTDRQTDRPTDWLVFVFHMSAHTSLQLSLSFSSALSVSLQRATLVDTWGESTSEIVLKTVEIRILDNGDKEGGGAPWLYHFKYERIIHVQKSEWNLLSIKCWKFNTNFLFKFPHGWKVFPVNL